MNEMANGFAQWFISQLVTSVLFIWICVCSMAIILLCLYMQVQCGDVELERKIDEKIEQFIDRVEKHPNKKNQVLLPQACNLSCFVQAWLLLYLKIIMPCDTFIFHFL